MSATATATKSLAPKGSYDTAAASNGLTTGDYICITIGWVKLGEMMMVRRDGTRIFHAVDAHANPYAVGITPDTRVSAWIANR